MTEPTTPPPQYSTVTPPTDAPGSMGYEDKARFRHAAFRAKSALIALLGEESGSVIGELVARELSIIDEFGWTLGADGFGRKLMAAVNALPTSPSVSTASRVRGTYTPTDKKSA